MRGQLGSKMTFGRTTRPDRVIYDADEADVAGIELTSARNIDGATKLSTADDPGTGKTH